MKLSTCQAARLIGVSRNTLLRWFRERRVGDVSRDRNGWRFFNPEDIKRIKAYADKKIPPVPGPVGKTEVAG
jgi:predicted site-specific integrase-resolvase